MYLLGFSLTELPIATLVENPSTFEFFSIPWIVSTTIFGTELPEIPILHVSIENMHKTN